MEPNADVPIVAADKNRHPMEVLLKQRGDQGQTLKTGDLIEGAILEKKGSRIFVDLGRLGTGIVYGREYYAASDAIKRMAEGDRIAAKVVEPDNDEGYIELSLKEAGREKNWQELEKLRASGELIRLPVLEANRGGLMLEHLGVAGFLPASQLSQAHYPRVEGGDKEKIYEELKKLVGQELEVTVIDVSQSEEKLIFSEKSRETEAVRQKLAAYHAGDVIDGRVTGIVSFGAFVKFGGDLEGLVHISEIDWQLISNPGDVLKIGQEVRAKIIGIEGERVSLSLKALKPDPWAKVEERYKPGDAVKGLVTRFNPFGAFVKLDDEIQGLAHVSEFGTEANMREMLRLNEAREFRVLSLDSKEHRLALGLPRKDTEAPPTASAEAPQSPVEEPSPSAEPGP